MTERADCSAGGSGQRVCRDRASKHAELIQHEHAEYLARSIPNAEFAILDGVTHFAPLQRPRGFNARVLEFVAKVLPREGGKV